MENLCCRKHALRPFSALQSYQPSCTALQPEGTLLGMCVQISDGTQRVPKGTDRSRTPRNHRGPREHQSKSTRDPQQKEICFEPRRNQHKPRSSPRLCPPQQSGRPQPGSPLLWQSSTSKNQRAEDSIAVTLNPSTVRAHQL